RECRDLRARIAEQAAAPPVPSAEEMQGRDAIKKLSAERDDLARRLAAADAAAASLAASQGAAGVKADADRDREISDLTSRYDMAVRDMRDLKAQNEER